jgi:hypothetical protein
MKILFSLDVPTFTLVRKERAIGRQHAGAPVPRTREVIPPTVEPLSAFFISPLESEIQLRWRDRMQRL